MLVDSGDFVAAVFESIRGNECISLLINIDGGSAQHSRAKGQGLRVLVGSLVVAWHAVGLFKGDLSLGYVVDAVHCQMSKGLRLIVLTQGRFYAHQWHFQLMQNDTPSPPGMLKSSRSSAAKAGKARAAKRVAKRVKCMVCGRIKVGL
jgi:hypothetical protein